VKVFAQAQPTEAVRTHGCHGAHGLSSNSQYESESSKPKSKPHRPSSPSGREKVSLLYIEGPTQDLSPCCWEWIECPKLGVPSFGLGGSCLTNLSALLRVGTGHAFSQERKRGLMG